MSKQQTDNEFRSRADAFIRLANEQRQDVTNDKVNASLLYAVTRFNAFVVASAAQNAEATREDKDEAVRYFTQKFSEMLVENIDDYIGNYQDYIHKVQEDMKACAPAGVLRLPSVRARFLEPGRFRHSRVGRRAPGLRQGQAPGGPR